MPGFEPLDRNEIEDMFSSVWKSQTSRIRRGGDTSLKSTAPDCKLFDIPIFPVEIWENIFELATDIPGSYTVTSFEAIQAFTQDLHGICIRTAYYDSMSIKLALSMTCRAFKLISQRFLFRYIRIASPSQALLVAKAFERLAAEDAVNNAGLESKEDLRTLKEASVDYIPRYQTWTFRIELALESAKSWTRELHTHAMFSIFQHCSYVIAFSTIFSTVEFPTHFDLPVLILFLNRLPTVKRLEVNGRNSLMKVIQHYLGNRLEVLWLARQAVSAIASPASSGIPFFFPRMSVLVTEGVIGMTVVAPSLQAFIGEKRNYPEVATSIEFLDPVHPPTPGTGSLGQWLKLRSITMEYYGYEDASWSIVRDFSHPRIECINIKSLMSSWSGPLKGTAYHRKLEWISRERFPALKRLKLHIPVQNAKAARAFLSDESRDTWKELLQRCEANGIRISVSRGMKEWVGDHWEEMNANDVFEMLFMSLERIEEELSGSWSASAIWKMMGDSPNQN